MRCAVNVSLCHENRGNSTYSFVTPKFLPPQISGFGLYLSTQGHICALRSPCVVLRAVPRACCLRTTPLGYYCRERQRGMCLGSVGSGLDPGQPHRWLESQSLFLSPSILFSSAPEPPPPFSTAPPPCADEDISSCKQRRAKNKSLCARGMHKTGENMPLKRC